MSEIVMIIERCANALGNAVVQSLWQCVLVGALAAAVAMCSRRAAVRYGVWCAGMLACAAWFALTFVVGMRVERPLELAGYAGRVRGGVMAAGPEAGSSGVVGAASVGLFEIVAMLWLCGFAFVSVRFVMQWRAAQLLRTRGLVAAGAEWQTLFEDVRGVFGVSRRVCLRVSERARCPMVVGVLVPVVVVPASVLLMLSPAQVRMVLAHELAHVRRYDHVVNMLQVLIETVMFYHPVVWWMSHQARLEREHCCDDAAVRMCGDAVAYARALTELEEVRQSSRAVLAINDGSSLMNRITRILGCSDRQRLGSGSVRTLAVLAAGTVIAAAGITSAAMRGSEARAETVAHVSGDQVVAHRGMPVEKAGGVGYGSSEAALMHMKVQRLMEQDQAGILMSIEVSPITPEGEAGGTIELEIKVEPSPEPGKLTPMDDAYWYHQGIRPLEAYDESFGDDC